MEKTTILQTVIYKDATQEDVDHLVREYALVENGVGIGLLPTYGRRPEREPCWLFEPFSVQLGGYG